MSSIKPGVNAHETNGHVTSNLPPINRVRAGEAGQSSLTQADVSPAPPKSTLAAVSTAGAGVKQGTGPVGFDCPVMGQVSFEDCLTHARQMRGLPQCGFSLPTLIGMVSHLTHSDPELDEIYAANPYTFRVTTATGVCAREAVLTRLFGAEKYVSPQSTFWTWRGEIIHAIKQAATQQLLPNVGTAGTECSSSQSQGQEQDQSQGHIQEWPIDSIENEQRLGTNLTLVVDTAQIGPIEVEVTVTGKPDSVFVWQAQVDTGEGEGGDVGDAVTLVDYKTSEFLPSQAKPEHAAQANVYNYLRKKNGLQPATQIAISYISLKGECHHPVAIWPDVEVEAYLANKLTPIIESLLVGSDENGVEDSWLPARLNPLDRNAGGWKCNGYCQHTKRCWPTGVPGAAQQAAAKQAASAAGRRAWYGSLKN